MVNAETQGRRGISSFGANLSSKSVASGQCKQHCSRHVRAGRSANGEQLPLCWQNCSIWTIGRAESTAVVARSDFNTLRALQELVTQT
jgi:hypothetical protein